MSQHFTRNTVSAQFYCAKCKRVTAHRIDDRRKGPCLECIARLEQEYAARPQKNDAQSAKQEELFR